MTRFEDFQAFNMPKFKKKFLFWLVLGLLAFVFLPRMAYNVLPGEKAVIYKRFQGGLDKDKVRGARFLVKSSLE